MRRLPVIFLAMLLLGTVWGCKEEERSFVANVGDSVPTMTTHDVSTFISDSGYTRYHIITDLWQMFEDNPEPFWRFPTGLYLEQYDENMKPAANIVCDSATYLSRKRIWQLDGNVVMVNVERDSFLTQQLFWDQNRQKVYSDSFIHIVRADRIIEGYGFESNQNMTAYTVQRPTGIIPVNRPEPALAQTSGTASADSDSVAPAAPVQGRRGAPVRASQKAATEDNISPPPSTAAQPRHNDTQLKPRSLKRATPQKQK